MIGLSTLPTAEALITGLNNYGLNKSIEARRDEIISHLQKELNKFSSALSEYRDKRHKGVDISLPTTNKEAIAAEAIKAEAIKAEAIGTIRALNLVLNRKVIACVSLDDLGKIAETRRVAYVMAQLWLARYQDKISHLSPGLSDRPDDVKNIIDSFIRNLEKLLRTKAFTSGHSHTLKKTIEELCNTAKSPESVRRLSNDIEKSVESLHTLLESIGRFDPITIVRHALRTQYGCELEIYFRQLERKTPNTAVLPDSIHHFIYEHGDLPTNGIINRLSHEICSSPKLAMEYELNSTYISEQIIDAEKRSGIPIESIRPVADSLRTPRAISTSASAWSTAFSPSHLRHHSAADSVGPEATRTLAHELDAAAGSGAESREHSVSTTTLAGALQTDALERRRSGSSSPTIV